MKDLLFPLIIVFASLVAGYIFGRYYEKRWTHLKEIRINLQKIALMVVNPIAFLGAVWIAPIGNLKIITLPVICSIAIISGGFIAYMYCRLNKLGPKQTGSLTVVGGFTNIGSIGGIVVFFFLGEAGFSLVPIYKLLEEVVNYGIGFPVAKSFSDQVIVKENRLKAIFKDPFIMTMLVAVVIGIILNISPLERPLFYSKLNPVLITLATVMLLMSIGMAFHFTSMKKHLKHGASVALLKTLLVPVIACSAVFLFKLNGLENGLILKVVLILSAMPAGFVSLVPPTIYDLDIHLSNTAWLSTMFTLVYTIPLLGFLISLI